MKGVEDGMSIHLTEEQKSFVDCRDAVKVFVGKHGKGKTFVGAYDYLVNAKPGERGVVVAPTYAMLRNSTQRVFLELAESLGLLTRFTRSTETAILRNGHHVKFICADSQEAILGLSLSRAWIDDAQYIEEQCYNLVCSRLHGDDAVVSVTYNKHWTEGVFGDKRRSDIVWVESQ